MKTENSQALLARSRAVIPGGVNSPVRSFASVGGTPRFMQAGSGAQLWDADGNAYIDYVCSWGAIILGHAHPAVVAAVSEQAKNGLGYGTPTELECRFAELICARLPSISKVRTVASGTEATMSALRLARGFTGRHRFVKFAGCYHGHADALLVEGGSGIATLAIPACPGVPPNASVDTAVLPYNDSQAVVDYFAQHGDATAAIIVEPIAGNMNLVAGTQEFLQTLRSCCDRYGAVLIFDEVMSGFRVGSRSSQGLLNITSDLTCLGKVIGGGLGVAAFGGRQEIMDCLAPAGAVYQAGTLAGNPVALSAGIATLQLLDEDFYTRLAATAQKLADGLNAIPNKPVAFCAQSIGGMLGIYFTDSPPTNFAAAQAANLTNFKQFFHAMLEQNIYFAPSAFEAGFVTAAHTDVQIQQTITTAQQVFHHWQPPT